MNNRRARADLLPLAQHSRHAARTQFCFFTFYSRAPDERNGTCRGQLAALAFTKRENFGCGLAAAWPVMAAMEQLTTRHDYMTTKHSLSLHTIDCPRRHTTRCKPAQLHGRAHNITKKMPTFAEQRMQQKKKVLIYGVLTFVMKIAQG